MSSEHFYTGTTRLHASIPRTTQAGQSSASDLVSVLGLDALGHQNTDTQVGCAGTVPGGHFAETAVIPGDFADHHFGTRDMSNAPSRTSLPGHITDHRPTPLHRPNNRPACSKRGGLVPAASMRGASGNLRCHCHHQIGRIILGWLECRSPSESPTPMTTCILCSSTAAHLSQSTQRTVPHAHSCHLGTTRTSRRTRGVPAGALCTAPSSSRGAARSLYAKRE